MNSTKFKKNFVEKGALLRVKVCMRFDFGRQGFANSARAKMRESLQATPALRTEARNWDLSLAESDECV